MTFTQFLRTLWARRWIVAICAAACTLGGIIGVMLLPRTYTAEARVMLDVGNADPITGETISSNFARSYLPTQAELIKDSSVSGRVVDRLGLADSTESRGEASDLRRRLAQEVSDATNAYPVENSNVIVIEYRASDPRTAAKMANAVRDAYAEQSLASKREAAIKSAVWFENQAGQLRAQLQAAEAKKAAFERENNIVLLDDGTDADTARLQSLSGSIDAPQVATTGGASGVSTELAQMDARIAAALQTLGPNHPQVQDLRAQRAALAASARSGGGVSTVVTGPSISSQVAGARARVLAQRGKTEEARRLFTDVKVIQDQYGKLVGRAADLRQAAASNVSGVTLLDSAIAPSAPSSPKIPQILIGSIALGFILGLLLAIVTELLARRVRGQEDVESLGVPLIGIIAGKSGVRHRLA